MSDYAYLIGVSLIALLWIVLYLYRKDVRKEMLIMSSIVFVFGEMMQYFVWTKDWWQPKTLTGTILGIEDFLGLFGAGGVAAVIYEELFQKKLGGLKDKSRFSIYYALILLVLFASSHGISSLIFGLHPWVAWVIATIIPIIFIYFLRPDLILGSVATGIIWVVFSFIGYPILYLIHPAFLSEWFMLNNLTGIIFFNFLPLEDIIWWMTFGMFIGPLYKFITNAKLQPLKNKL